MTILIVLCALNLALLAAVLVMLRRMRGRINRVLKVQRREARYPWWPQFEALLGIYRLLDGKADLPNLRHWALSPDILLHVLRHIKVHAPRRIVECGSGSSTIAMAQALRALGIDGHIYSIENYEPSAAAVREQLRRHDLERFVTLVFVPLVEKRYEGFDAPIAWYDLGSESDSRRYRSASGRWPDRQRPCQRPLSGRAGVLAQAVARCAYLHRRCRPAGRETWSNAGVRSIRGSIRAGWPRRRAAWNCTPRRERHAELNLSAPRSLTARCCDPDWWPIDGC